MVRVDKQEAVDCIVLAGGLGTRLRDVVANVPKCMAPVAGKPFLSYVIDELRLQGIRRFVFSIGFRSEMIEAFLRTEYPTLDYVTVTEHEPLGTGGAIRFAMKEARSENVLVVNGDTLFKADIKQVLLNHESSGAECTIALKPMQNFERYGAVMLDRSGKVESFSEKNFYAEGFINGGIYIIRKNDFFQRELPDKFSFEKDYLEKFTHEQKFFGNIQDRYFIDIGIPSDYSQAQKDLKRDLPGLSKIDKSWTLFLDRDGVINNETVGTYVKNWNEFIFSKGVLDTFKKLSDHFGHILVVSNQRGVGRGLMSEADLQSIHHEMQREVEIVGGRIDKIYYCTEKEDTCFYRKPNPGMALLAREDFPDIDLSKSIMVGNKPGDMKFGRYAGMFTVFIRSTNPDQPFPHPDIDAIYESLADFASDVHQVAKTHLD